MARETHPPPPSGPSPWALPGLGKGRGYRLYGDPTRGASLVAPTAPHATTPPGRPTSLSGPARFWDGTRIRVALALAFILSLAAHWFVAPWNLLPPSSGIEFHDPAGELSIPVDLLGGEEPPPPPPPEPAPAPAPPAPPPETTPKAPKDPLASKPDAGPKVAPDAGATVAKASDAGADGDGGAPVDAGAPDGSSTEDGGLVAMADAGAVPGSAGPGDPASMFGLSKVVNAGVQNVVLGVNVAVIRKHPIGARMGPILQAIPQWRDFLKGGAAAVDPIRDTDWILIYGPSLIHTDKDAVLVRYNITDVAVDAAIQSVARTYDKGGAFDAGVPGVSGSLGFADNAQRVFLRPQPKLLVIVPPSHAHEAALTFRKQVPRGPAQTEAMRLIVRNPSNQISIPGLKFSTSLTEIRFWVLPRTDGGADVYAEGDCTDEAAAADSAERLTAVLKRQNSIGVRFATRGLLNDAEVVADGTKLKLHIVASPEQMEAVLQLAGAAVGAQVAPPSGPTPHSQ
ncbi:MAG TPA: hypothetical protein VM580_27450 [Labilithrix sp.]|nr:hypothetical protein [Labilithrix sp.]